MAENHYDLDYTGSMVDRILDTGYDLQNQGYIFRGLASHFTGTPTERTWLIAPTGSTGFGLSSPVPPGSIGICMYNGSSWSAEVLNTLTLDTAPTTGSGNGITSGAVKTLAESITNAIGQLEQSVSDRFTSLELEDTTGSLQAEVLSITLKYVFEGETETLTSLSILAATAEKAGLMSAADKQKLDAFVTNIRSLRIQDTTAQDDQDTEITNTLKWTIGGVTEAITAFTLYAATTSKAGLMSAADKTALDTLPSLINAGYLYAGIATPSTVPSSTSAKIFYIAIEGGTYTSFGNLNVTQGINIIYKSGNAWSAAQVVGIDAEPTTGSENLVKSGGVANTFNKFIDINDELQDNVNSIYVSVGFLEECYVDRTTDDRYCLYYAYYNGNNYTIWITKTSGNVIGRYESPTKESFVEIDLDSNNKLYAIINWDKLYNPDSKVFYYQKGYLSDLAYNLDYSPSVKYRLTSDSLQTEIDAIQEDLSSYEVIPITQLTTLGSAYMNDHGGSDTSTHLKILQGFGFLYYYPVVARKRYKLSSDISWSYNYASIGFSENVPVIGNSYDMSLIMADNPSETIFVPDTDGYVILTYRGQNSSYIYNGQILSVNTIQQEINSLTDNMTVSEEITDPILLGKAYLNDHAGVDTSNHKHILSGYGTVYYYPVVSGRKYLVSSELQWNALYGAVGFSAALPVIGNAYDTTLIMSDTPVSNLVFIPETDGYVLLSYRSTWKSYLYKTEIKPISEVQNEVSDIHQSLPTPLKKHIICSGSSITWGGGGPSVLDSSMVQYVDKYIKNVMSKSLLANSDKISYSEDTDVSNGCMYNSTGKMISGAGATVEFDFIGDEIAICQMKRRTGTDYGVMKVTADGVEIGVFDNKNVVKHTEETFSGESLSEVRLANPCTFNHQIYINGSATPLDNVVINASLSTSAHIPGNCNAWVFRATKGDGSETCHGIQFAESLGTITSVRVAYDYGRVIAHERSTIGQTDNEYTNESYYGAGDVSYDPDQPVSGVGSGLEFRAIDRRAFFIHKFEESKKRHFKIEIIGGTNPYFILNYVTNRYHDLMNAGIGGWELMDLLYREDKLNHWTQFFKYYHPDVLFEEAMTNDDWSFGVRRISRSIGEITLSELQKLHQLEVHKITYNSSTDKYAVEMCTGIISSITPTSLISTDIIGTDTEVGDIIRIGNYHSDMHQITCRKITEVNLTTGEVKWSEPLVADDILMIDEISDLVGAEINIRSFVNGTRNYKQFYQDLIDKVHSVSANTKIVVVHNGLPNLYTRQLWGYDIIHAELCKENVNVEFVNAQEHIYDTMFNTITGARKETVVSTGASSYDLSFTGTTYGGWQGFKVLVNGVDVYGKDAYIEMDMAYRLNTNVSGATANKTNPYDRSKSGWNRTGAALTLHFIKNIPTSNDTIEVQYADTIWSNDFCHVTDFGAKVYGESYNDILNKI